MRRERVHQVLDGDTFRTASGRYIRLEGVDAPERGDNDGLKAKRALENLVLGELVSIHVTARGFYGREIAQVRANGKSVNRALQDLQFDQGWNRG